jgi:predicted RNA-binding protein with TRAM domain
MYKERSFGGQNRGGFAPVKVGQELDVKIEAVGQKGDGIAKEKGFVLFIPGAKENDEVRVRITKVLRNVGFAEVIGKSTGKPSTEVKEETQDSEESSDTAEETQEEASEESESTSPEDSEDFGEEQKEEN